MKKKRQANRSVDILQRDIKQRFGGADKVTIDIDGDVIRVREINPELRRTVFALDLRAEAGADEIELSFSSEARVRVWGEDEILSHDPGDCSFERLKEVGSILKNHRADAIVGVPTKVWLDEATRRGRLKMRFGTTDCALEARKEVLDDKTLRGVSVGYLVHEWVVLKDDSVSYNNRIKGPGWIAVDWEALEASLTPIPADPDVGVNRSQKAPQPEQQERSTMNEKQRREKILAMCRRAGILAFAQTLIDDKTSVDDAQTRIDAEVRRLEDEGIEVTPETDDVPAAGAKRQAGDGKVLNLSAEAQREAAEVGRQAGLDAVKEARKTGLQITALCRQAGCEDMADALIEEGVTLDVAKARIFDEQTKRNKPVDAQVIRDGRTSLARAICDGLHLRAGGTFSGKDGDKPAPGADDFRGRSLMSIGEDLIRRAGLSVPSDIRAKVELMFRGPPISSEDLKKFRASGETISHGTTDFPLILANTANKALLEGFRARRTTYQRFCKIGSLQDFKQASRLRLSESGELELVPEKGQYKENQFAERKENIQLATFGKLFTLSRQAVINDDLDAFTSVAMKHGDAAARKPNRLAIALLNSNPTLSDGVALFATGRGNLSANSAYALDTEAHARDGIANAVKRLRLMKAFLENSQKEIDEVELELEPAILLMPATAEFYGKIALGSATLPGATAGSGIINPFQGIAEPIVEPALENEKLNGSSTAWYLFADPRLAPVIEVAFLQGDREPYMEEMDQTNVDGRVWKVRLDCAAAVVDYAGAIKEAGA